jgi:predicted transposase/invertase (TIGR01784 family)
VKTDTIFYQLFQNFPQIFFELIGQPEVDPRTYKFAAPEVKQRAFRLDGLFQPVLNNPHQPIYFLEVQFQKKLKFYPRLFAEIFTYFDQYDQDTEWYAVVIYPRRSIETPANRQYRELMAHRLRQIYLDEIVEIAEQSIGIGIVKLVVESKRKAGEVARHLIERAKQELTDAEIQKQVIELIETVILSKFANLSRQEIEAMLKLPELKKTKVYQEALEEGRQEGLQAGRQEGLQAGRQEGLQAGREAGREEGLRAGREEGQLAQLKMVSKLLQRGDSLEEIADLLELEVEVVREMSQQQK